MATSFGHKEHIADGATLLRCFAAEQSAGLLLEIANLEHRAPFRHMATRRGFPMAVAMTNCGELGWVTDRRGYRYEAEDPCTGLRWPPMSPLFAELASAAAEACGYMGFAADSCLVNRYGPATRLSLHQDKDERDFGMPIVSVSLGLPAVFLLGGPTRHDHPRRLRLEHGDVVVWGGPARLAFHGVASVAQGCHPLTGCARFNLTFRKAR